MCDWSTQPLLESGERSYQLVARGKLLDHDRGRAHCSRHCHQRVVRHLIDIDDCHRSELLECVASDEPPDVWVSAPSCSQDGGAHRQVLELFRVEAPHHLGQPEIAHGLHPNPDRVGREVGQGHLLDVNDLDRVWIGPGLDGTGCRCRSRLVQRFVARHFVE